MATFTEELREAAGDQWERVISHKFTIELAKGEIDRDGECPIILWFYMLYDPHNQHNIYFIYTWAYVIYTDLASYQYMTNVFIKFSKNTLYKIIDSSMPL